MMKFRHFKPTVFATLITLCTATVHAAEPIEKTKAKEQQASVSHPDLKAFPPAKAGMERFVIVLPHKERGNENAFRVELIPGKMMETDGVNLYSIASKLVEKNLEGWAYSFYEISDGPVKMTAMKPGTTPVIKFVQAPSLLTQYIISRPIVIYAPAGYEIRYRIWRAEETFHTAPNG